MAFHDRNEEQCMRMRWLIACCIRPSMQQALKCASPYAHQGLSSSGMVGSETWFGAGIEHPHSGSSARHGVSYTISAEEC